MPRLILISDTHNHPRALRDLPDGDILVHAGDLTGRGSAPEVERALHDIAALPYAHKVLICGNHDFLFQDDPERVREILDDLPGLTYLQDSAATVMGLKFYGSPWQPWFYDWAFNFPERSDGSTAKATWAKIPTGVDVLITHGPPFNIYDETQDGRRVGCPHLREALRRICPRLHVFGHIHEARGDSGPGPIRFINAAALDRAYEVKGKPFVVDLDPRP